jgi:hypothetical protein
MEFSSRWGNRGSSKTTASWPAGEVVAHQAGYQRGEGRTTRALLTAAALAWDLGPFTACGGGGDDDTAPPPPPPPTAASVELTAIVEAADEVLLRWTAPDIHGSAQGYAIYANDEIVDWTWAPVTAFLWGQALTGATKCFVVALGRWEYFLFFESGLRSEEICVDTPLMPPVPPLATGWTSGDAGLSRAVDVVPTVARQPRGYSSGFLCDSAPGEAFSTLRGIGSADSPTPRLVNGTACRVVVDWNWGYLHVFTIVGSELHYQSLEWSSFDRLWRQLVPEQRIAGDVDGGLGAAMGHVDPMDHRMHAVFTRAGQVVWISAPYTGPYTGWREEVIGDGLTGPRSLVVASDGTVYAAFATAVQGGIGELAIHARDASGIWTRVGSFSDVVVTTSMGAASIVAPVPGSVDVALARLDPATGASRPVHARLDGGAWSETWLDPDADAAPAPAITADSADGSLFIAHGASRIDRRLLDYDLRLAARRVLPGVAPHWELRVIDEEGYVAEKVDIATSVSWLDAVALLYSDRDGPSRLAYGP